MNFSLRARRDRISQEFSNRKIIARFVIFFILYIAFLFGSAGTFRWFEAWAYLIIQFSFSMVLVTWLKKNNPDLLKERMTFLKKSARNWDKAILLLSIPIFVALFITSGLDAVRYHWSEIPTFLKVTGFAAMLVSSALIFLVMRENTYLSRIVEIQKERGHKVITTGPYQYVRHPMYVGVCLWLLCIPFALGSLYALIPSSSMVILVILRTYLEDRTLHKELPGYEEYAGKVKYRLIPGVW